VLNKNLPESRGVSSCHPLHDGFCPRNKPNSESELACSHHANCHKGNGIQKIGKSKLNMHFFACGCQEHSKQQQPGPEEA